MGPGGSEPEVLEAGVASLGPYCECNSALSCPTPDPKLPSADIGIYKAPLASRPSDGRNRESGLRGPLAPLLIMPERVSDVDDIEVVLMGWGLGGAGITKPRNGFPKVCCRLLKNLNLHISLRSENNSNTPEIATYNLEQKFIVQSPSL